MVIWCHCTLYWLDLQTKNAASSSIERDGLSRMRWRISYGTRETNVSTAVQLKPPKQTLDRRHGDRVHECPLSGVKRTSRLCCGADGWRQLNEVVSWAAGGGVREGPRLLRFPISRCSIPTQHIFHVEAGCTLPIASDARRPPCRSSAVC